MSNIIKVENLGKRYILRHQGKEKYLALRDIISKKAAGFGNRLLHPLSKADSAVSPYQEEFWALRDVSFEIKRGSRVGIIGRNGAGKTTLLKILSRITELSKGRVTIKGRVASLLEVGTGFHPELTGRENIFLNGAILGMSRLEIKSKFDEIVAFAEVEKFLDTPVKRYSSGMHVRLAFAVAAHLEPEILLVDEVLAVGDAQFQKKCLGKMEDISVKEGRTIVFVSHNMGAIKNLCNRCILFDRGKVICDDSPDTAINLYLSDIFSKISSRAIIPKKPGSLIQVTRLVFEDSKGEEVSSLEMGQDVYLAIDYLIEKMVRNSMLACLVSKEGIPLFYTYDTDMDEALEGYRDTGKYSSRLLLPMSLFKEGQYTVSVLIGHGKDNLTDPNASVALSIVNNRFDLTHKSYRTDRPGFIFRDIKWDTRLRE